MLTLIVLVQVVMSPVLFLKVQDLDGVLSASDHKGRCYTHTSQRTFFERIAQQLIPESLLSQVKLVEVTLAQYACFPTSDAVRVQVTPARPKQA